MAKEQSHTGTTNTTPNSCVDCPVTITRRVSYLFQTGLWDKALASEKSLKIPYALAINGKAHSAYAKRAGVLKAYTAKDDIFVEPGQTVALFLNSDASPAYRKNPVFAVTPKDNDVEVIVYEKRGQLGGNDTPRFKETKELTDKLGNRRKVDVFEATLTGDIWLKVSHKYTLDEAKSLIPGDTPQEIRDAVLKLYDGTQNGEIRISKANGQDKPHTLTVTFEPAQNATQNIASFDLYKDGVTRVHPQAWVAVIDAAFKTGVTKVQTSSAWRPMLGSIAHRTGLGLDVSYLDAARLNRGELRSNKAPDTTNVSEEEKKLFAQKEAADREAAEAKAKLDKLNAEQTNLSKLKNTAPGKVDPLREAALPGEIEAAKKALQAATQKQSKTTDAWGDERDKNEPATVKSFRTHLSHCKCVKQLFDPWFMDINTQDAVPATPNLQKDGNETLHANHLHITVFDPTLPTS